MGLCVENLDTPLKTTSVQILVSEKHPYIRLANALNWKTMAKLICEDLKKSTRTCRWWIGRKLNVRIQLAVFILQCLVKMTDRTIEESIKGNGVYQVFCGVSIFPSTTVRQQDKASIEPIVQEHEALFEEKILTSIGTDKGYYSKANVKALREKKITQIGIQIPGNVKNQYHIPEKIKNRRAGIEPLIGHVKKFGLAKSNA
ncbi:MAG: hypothetical protein JW795_01075, partial [Chitinivibrionales bacterium]|nr:hypothetical protein [Chitinivibrionales bacterium]